ncbi:MAG: shikimate dehydrogenase, partial [Candidatus Accumulibacter sp.]|nr:shikimate dehydrogenase [Accumulibacter sp.]
MLSGKTTLIAHIGHPTESFKAPMIYNPWFEKRGLDAMVVPMGVRAGDYPVSLKQIFRFTNLRGALVTMPHKVATMSLADEASVTARIAGAANALLKREDGSLLADQFDGVGFARGAARKGFKTKGSKILIIGTGGVGSPIAASLAADGAASISLYNRTPEKSEGLA